MAVAPRAEPAGAGAAPVVDLAGAVADVVVRMAPAGRRVAVVVPDATRTVPLAAVAAEVDAALTGAGAASITWVVALGTHQPMGAAALAAHLGPVSGRVVNHEWWDPGALVAVGEVEVGSSGLTGRRPGDHVVVRLNRHVVDAEVALLVGPVFPHEVVGFSGGNKYLVPGVAGAEVIDATHWLGALITSQAIIGVPGPNPVRSLIDSAAALLPAERWCLALVVTAGGSDGRGELVHVAGGRPEAAWAEAASVSAGTHVRLLDRPVRRVVSVMAPRYQDLWTAAKGMYKVEPVVADGGEVVILAPHIDTVSVTHGEAIAGVGYHVRDYFTGQWDRFAGVPGGVLAHSTHLAGAGTWSAAGGEHRRIEVTLATGIDEATCRAHGLGWLDPATLDVDALEADPATLVVTDAGEVLYRLA